MSTTAVADKTLHAAKRARFTEILRTQAPRKLFLALESGIPEEVGWALGGLLLASCPAETFGGANTTERIDKPSVTDTASLVRNPHLLRALLPVLLAPKPEVSALQPTPPSSAHTHMVSVAQWRQAWLVLRNMSLMPENEALLAQSAALRLVLARTLRAAFRAHENDPALTVAELLSADVPGDAARAIAAETMLPDSAQGQCTISPYCVRGYRHCGRGGPCKLVQPSMRECVPRERLATADGAAQASEGATSAAAAASASSGLASDKELAGMGLGRACQFPPASPMAGSSAATKPLARHLMPAPPAVSAAYDPLAHVAAAETLSNMCRQIRLEDLESADAGTGVELCELLGMIVRCAETPLSLMGIEALGACDVPVHRTASAARLRGADVPFASSC